MYLNAPRALLALVLAPMIVLTGCDGGGSSKDKSGPDGGSEAPQTGTPGVVEEPAPGVDDPLPGIEDPAPGIEDPAPGIDDPAPGSTGGNTGDLGQYAADILGSAGVWRIQREIDAWATPAELEASGYTTAANAAQKDLNAFNWNLVHTGFFSVNPGAGNANVSRCLSGRWNGSLNETTLTSAFSPSSDYFLCDDRSVKVQKLAEGSYSMEQQCVAGDSVSVRLDRIASQGVFQNTVVSLRSDVIPSMFLNQNACAIVYTDTITESEAWDLVPSAHSSYYSGRFTVVDFYGAYEGRELQFSFSFNRLAVGTYRIGSVLGSSTPTASFSVRDSLPLEAGGVSFRAELGVVNVIASDSRGIELEFAVQDDSGGNVSGDAVISFQ